MKFRMYTLNAHCCMRVFESSTGFNPKSNSLCVRWDTCFSSDTWVLAALTTVSSISVYRFTSVHILSSCEEDSLCLLTKLCTAAEDILPYSVVWCKCWPVQVTLTNWNDWSATFCVPDYKWWARRKLSYEQLVPVFCVSLVPTVFNKSRNL